MTRLLSILFGCIVVLSATSAHAKYYPYNPYASPYYGTQYATTPTNENGTNTTNASTSGDFSIAIQSSKTTVEPEQRFVYTLTVTNNTGSQKENIQVELSLDDKQDAESASSGGRASSTAVVWRDQTFSAEASRTYTAVISVKRNTPDDETLYATAIVEDAFAETQLTVANDEDENNDNDRNIAVEVVSSLTHVKIDDSYRYTVKLRNNDDAKIRDVDLVLELPEEVEFLSASNRGDSSGNKVSWSGLDLKKHEERYLTASVRVSDDAADGEILHAFVYAEGAVHEHKVHVHDPYQNQEQVEVYAFTNQKSVKPGDDIEYTVRITNSGPTDDIIDVQAQLDPRTTFGSASEGGLQFDQFLIVWEDLAIKQDETISLTVSTTVDEEIEDMQPLHFSVRSGIGSKQVLTDVMVQIENDNEVPVAEQTADTDSSGLGGFLSRVTGAETATAAEENTAQPVLQLTTQSDTPEVQPGSVFTQSFTLQNTGTVPAQDLLVTAHFPVGSLHVTDAQSGFASGNQVEWSISTLAPGEMWRTRMTARASATLRHGTIIGTTIDVQSGNGILLASEATQTNVIQQLPQAGLDDLPIAEAPLQHIALKTVTTQQIPTNRLNQNTATDIPSIREQSQRSSGLHPLLWILVILTGIAGGMAAGYRVTMR